MIGLGGRVGDRRQVADDLVEIEQRAQAAGAALGAHPGFHRGEQQGDEEHALGVAQVGDVEDAVARPAVWADTAGLGISSGWPSIQVWKDGAARMLLSSMASSKRSFSGKKLSTAKAPSLSKGGVWVCRISSVRSSGLPLAPGVLEDIGEQDVLARAHRVDIVQPDQPQQGGDGAGDLLAQHLAVAPPRADCGRFKRGQDADRDARIRAGGVDGELRGVLQRAAAARGPMPQSARPFFQRCGGLGRQLLGRSLPSRRAASGSTQGWKSCGRRSGKCSSRLVRSPLGSIMMAGMPCKAASSSRPMHRPVLPEPVMPITTAWVVRSAGSYRNGWSVVLPARDRTRGQDKSEGRWAWASGLLR